MSCREQCHIDAAGSQFKSGSNTADTSTDDKDIIHSLTLYNRLQLVSHFMYVRDNPEMSILEYRRFRIFVDRDNTVRILHTRYMLKCTTYTHGEINLRLYGLSRTTDLSRFWKPLLIDDRP